MRSFFSYITLIILLPVACLSQEVVAPLRFNAVVHAANAQRVKAMAKLTSVDTVNLPFFDDFTNYSVFPDANKWVDNEAYVNNTMCIHPPTRGVATLDQLNAEGMPYDTLDNSAILYSDSLTSIPLDLGALLPGDSLYISFFYQPQGNGFFPKTGDSLMLFFHKKNNDWVKVWSVPGSTTTPFMQVMVPVTDTDCFFKGFQFRFINIGSFLYSGSQWNIDYVRMGKNRTWHDTAVNDVSYITDATPYLNDYTAMPYRQFLANVSGERATNHSDTIQNYTNASQSIPYGYIAKEITTNTSLATSTPGTAGIGAYGIQGVSFSNYTTTIPSPGAYKKVIFENKYYLQSPASDTNKANDTILHEQVFDNYLAYDDGTAEKSYFLNLFPTLPGYIAIEHHLNQPDTVRGMAIYFGRQVPVPFQKGFSLFIYSHLQGIDGSPTNDSIYWQDGYKAGYTDTVNKFWIYKFDKPVPLPAGTFYAGVFQPAFSGSDSLYYGLDESRVGGNHVYYNVLSVWNSSSVNGAVMIRPLIGQPIRGTGVETCVAANEWELIVSPNPAHNSVQITVNNIQSTANNANRARYVITDVLGRTYLTGTLQSKIIVDISTLPIGVYFVRLQGSSNIAAVKKFIKE